MREPQTLHNCLLFTGVDRVVTPLGLIGVLASQCLGVFPEDAQDGVLEDLRCSRDAPEGTVEGSTSGYIMVQASSCLNH